MAYLISHLWLLYLLSLALAGIAYIVIDIHDLEPVSCLISAFYAAIPELIAVSGLWFFNKGYNILAIIVAVLCCIAVVAAVFLFWADSKSHAYVYLPSKVVGIAACILGIVAVIICSISFKDNIPQIILTSCCMCGMISVAYITGYLTAFGKGMGKP